MIKIQICLLPMMYFRRMLVIRIWATIKMFLLERYVFIVNSKMYLFFHHHDSNKPLVYCCYFEMQSQNRMLLKFYQKRIVPPLFSYQTFESKFRRIWLVLPTSDLTEFPAYSPSKRETVFVQATHNKQSKAADEYNEEWVESFLDCLLWLFYAVTVRSLRI